MSQPMNTSGIKEWAEKTLKNIPGLGNGDNSTTGNIDFFKKYHGIGI